jgi:hypothetical protein
VVRSYAALCVGVQYHLVLRVLIHAFNDINLSALRPSSGSERPESRPCATDTSRHVLDVHDEESLVVCLGRFNANTATSYSAGDGERRDGVNT